MICMANEPPAAAATTLLDPTKSGPYGDVVSRQTLATPDRSGPGPSVDGATAYGLAPWWATRPWAT